MAKTEQQAQHDVEKTGEKRRPSSVTVVDRSDSAWPESGKKQQAAPDLSTDKGIIDYYETVPDDEGDIHYRTLAWARRQSGRVRRADPHCSGRRRCSCSRASSGPATSDHNRLQRDCQPRRALHPGRLRVQCVSQSSGRTAETRQSASSGAS